MEQRKNICLSFNFHGLNRKEQTDSRTKKKATMTMKFVSFSFSANAQKTRGEHPAKDKYRNVWTTSRARARRKPKFTHIHRRHTPQHWSTSNRNDFNPAHLYSIDSRVACAAIRFHLPIQFHAQLSFSFYSIYSLNIFSLFNYHRQCQGSPPATTNSCMFSSLSLDADFF